MVATLKSIKSGRVRPQAATILGCCERTLQKWMNHHDIALRDYKEAKPNVQRKPHLNSKIAKQIRLAFYDNDIPAKKLAEKYNVTQASIYRILANKTYKEITATMSGEAAVNVEHNV